MLVHDGPFADLDRTYGASPWWPRWAWRRRPIREYYLSATSTEVCWPVAGAPARATAVTERLEAAGCVAGEEAAELVAAALDAATLEAWVRRREQGEPLAWITGTLWFCGRPVRVDPGVYVPRYQTE